MTTETQNDMQTNPNAAAAGRFIAAAKGHNYPASVLDAARMTLVDTIGVGIGAHAEEAGQSVRQVAAKWGTSGDAQVLLGGKAAPAAAALVNATMAHCLDYDDTHVGAVAHLSSPAWNAALAVGMHVGASEREILSAYIAGFETGARLGGDFFGQTANERGFHSTGVFGCFAAAAASAVLLGLDEQGVRNALGAAATQVSGLVGSFGTMSKPFHSGKAAMNGILAAELAAEGFVAAEDLIETDGALANAIIQDGAVKIPALDYGEDWEVLQNTFKPYSSCLLTHPVIDAARSISDQVKGKEIDSIEVDVSYLCTMLAGKPNPQTGLEGKFSAAYCVALGLNGYPVTALDFSEERVQEPVLRDTLSRVTLLPSDDRDTRTAALRVKLADGSLIDAECAMALGNPTNPMSWDDMRTKFEGLVEPVLGEEKAAELFEVLRNFDDGSLDDYVRLVSA